MFRLISCIYTNLPPNGAFRGYGAMQSIWASERTMDLLAHHLQMDPLELRLKNVLVDGDRYCTGEEMHDVHFIDCLKHAAGAINWSASQRGKGLCVLMKGMQTPSRASIVVAANDDGTYTVFCATAEMGQDAWFSIRKMAAELLGVAPDRVHFPEPDTDVVPYDTRTTSSRSTYMMGRALVDAVQKLKENGEIGYGECVNTGGLDPDTGQGVASTHWHQGAGAAEVRVDEETGKFEVVKLHTAIYAGHVVNRAGAELQNEGSMIMGLGTTLFENIAFSDGQVMNANFSDYNIPAAGDIPDLTHELIEREGGAIHGLGETALPPVPPAIGNALYSLGMHVTDLPITAEHVLDAIDRRDSSMGEPLNTAKGDQTVKISCTVNGQAVELEARPDEMLLDVLRNTLHLTSVRATCGIGICGACTALINGEPISTCIYLAPMAEGTAITTIEGLDGIHPIQQALEEKHTPSSAAIARLP